MGIKDVDVIELPATADFHVHLRDGEMMETVVPTIRQGGVNTVFVMSLLADSAKPNLVPPITTVQQCLEYKQRLESIEPNVTYLMSLYLHESITPQTIIEAKASKAIYGVKSYPAGVTTNSSSGVIDYEVFYPVFAELERQDLVLNLHGECPSAHGITVLNAEEKFLPTLLSIHARFPQLRIVLEHCTTAAALHAVQQCNPSRVVGTITAHHLHLTIDDVVGNNAHFCKPVAKTDRDRAALLRAAVSASPQFFLGTDSAPHPRAAKIGAAVFGKSCAAGVFTQPYATQTVLDALEAGVEAGVIADESVTLATLENFLSGFGRAFYAVPDAKLERIVLRRGADTVIDILHKGDVKVVPFRANASTWSLEWKSATS